jgi:hypothetical protein
MRVEGKGYRHHRHFVHLPDSIMPSLVRRGAGMLAAIASIAPLQIAGFFIIALLLLANYIPLQLDGDEILLSIMSIQKLTVYYWAQDRYGNLASLLTAWIQNPIYNAYAQLFIRLLAGLMAPLFYCALVFRRSVDVWCATLLSCGLLLLVGSVETMRFIYVQANPYSTSLACAGLGAMALRAQPARFGRTLLILIGAVVLLAAYIVNFGLVIVALPLVGLFATLLPSAGMIRLLLIHLLAAVVGCLLPGIAAPEYHTDLGLALSFQNIAHYAGVIWHSTRWPFVLAVLLPLAVLFVGLVRAGRLRMLRLFVTLNAAMLGIATLYFVLVASSRWLVLNDFLARYFVPGYLLLASVAGNSLWLVARVSLRRRAVRDAAFAGLATVLMLAAYTRLHARGLSNHDIIVPGKSEIAREVAARYVALSLDGIVGDYWYVWPAVLMAEQYHYDNGYVGPHVFGAAFRGGVRHEEFAARLAAQGRLRLACIDLAPAECSARTSAEMGLPGLRFSEFSPMEPLAGDHRLWFVQIMPPEVAR